MKESKTLGVTDMETLKNTVSDVEVHAEPSRSTARVAEGCR